jgi:hypothetical protein
MRKRENPISTSLRVLLLDLPLKKPRREMREKKMPASVAIEFSFHSIKDILEAYPR